MNVRHTLVAVLAAASLTLTGCASEPTEAELRAQVKDYFAAVADCAENENACADAEKIAEQTEKMVDAADPEIAEKVLRAAQQDMIEEFEAAYGDDLPTEMPDLPDFSGEGPGDMSEAELRQKIAEQAEETGDCIANPDNC